jgi:hypothetical protein
MLATLLSASLTLIVVSAVCLASPTISLAIASIAALMGTAFLLLFFLVRADHRCQEAYRLRMERCMNHVFERDTQLRQRLADHVPLLPAQISVQEEFNEHWNHKAKAKAGSVIA